MRLLVDDLHVGDMDRLLLGLAGFPNVQVRLFKPLPARGGSVESRLQLSLHEFSRVNRRMHNKLFIADNVFAISGGRNVADEYFTHGEAANFLDMDVLATGPVVRELSHVFDRYWNGPLAYPIEQLAASMPAQAAREAFDTAVRDATVRLGERQHDLLGNPNLLQQFDQGRIEPGVRAGAGVRRRSRQGCRRQRPAAASDRGPADAAAAGGHS